MTRIRRASSRPRTFRVMAAAAGAAAALLLAACGAGGNPLAEPSTPGASAGGSVVVGSANFTESQVLGELYAQALKAKGIDASVKANIGSREVYLGALKDGSVQLVPEYTGNLLLYLDSTSTAATREDVESQLKEKVGSDYALGPVSEAADQDVYVVTKAYADQHQLASIADLSKVAGEAVLGGPGELAERPYGPPGLKEKYGITLKDFKPLDASAVRVKDLNDGKVQVATFFTTEALIGDNGYVMLSDPEHLILPQNVVPLMAPAVADQAGVTEALQGVQQALTTEELTALNKSVDSDKRDPGEVAGEWLKAKGLA